MADPFDFDFLCIGSGPAGQRAAVQAAKLGKKVAVIERTCNVGGVCIETGTIPSKSLREGILTRNSGDRKPTPRELLAEVQGVIQRECKIVSQQLHRNDVTVIHGLATFKDPHTLQIDGEPEAKCVTSQYILIAVGTRPADPPGVPADNHVVISSDGVRDLQTMPRTLAVVGAGVIGLEYASMFAALGVEVTLIDQRPRPLEFMDGEIVDELIHQMRDANVTFRLNEKVERLEISQTDSSAAPRGIIHLESGKRIVSDVILYSAGRIGATAALNLPAAGLAADERGRIKVDEHFRTSIPHIYAAGDVIGYPSLAATSSEQGRLVACHAFNHDPRPMASHFPVGIYAIPELSMVGLPEHELTLKKIPYETGVARYREIARGQILGDDTGMLKLIFHRENWKLLGVHAIGTGATELIHIGQAVIGLGGGLDYFMHTVFNYPTLAECYKVAALDAYNKLIA